MNPSAARSHALIISMVALLLIVACIIPETVTPVPQADPNAFNTAVAQTAAAATPLAFGGNPATAIPTIVAPTALASNDEQEIRKALLEKLGWEDSQMEFSLAILDGSAAVGTVRLAGQTGGADWFAIKNNGQWAILQVGQGWPPCRALEPYNIPVSAIPSCEDDSGMTVERAAAGNTAPPSNPTIAVPLSNDFQPPDPLGPAWTGFWIDQGTCYDMDIFSLTESAACDLKLGANNLFTPQNGALFDAAPYQYAPSMNTCKSAPLASAAFAARNVMYICFKTNSGKYGFLIPREVQTGGVVFDAYLFP